MAPEPIKVEAVELLSDLSRSGYINHEPQANAHLPVSVIAAPVMNQHGDVIIDIAAQPLRRMRPV